MGHLHVLSSYKLYRMPNIINIIALTLSWMVVPGCNSFTPPTAEADFEAKVKAGVQTSQDLLDQFKREDQALRYISRGTYNCIDTKTERKLNALKKAAPYLQAELADKTSSVSMDLQYLDAYQASLNNVASDEKFLASAVKTISAAAGGFPIVGGGAKAIGAITAAAAPYGEAGILIEMARYYQDELDAKVAQLKAELATPVKADQAYYFDKWDACMSDEFAYLIEVQLGTQYIPKYRPAGFGIDTYPSFTAESSGTELRSAYLQYLATRDAQLKLQVDLEKALDAVQDANTKLANGEFPRANPAQSAGDAGAGGQTTGGGGQSAAAELCAAVSAVLTVTGDKKPPKCAKTGSGNSAGG